MSEHEDTNIRLDNIHPTPYIPAAWRAAVAGGGYPPYVEMPEWEFREKLAMNRVQGIEEAAQFLDDCDKTALAARIRRLK